MTTEHPGLAVRALRLRLGLTQEKLAERCDIDRTEIAQVETGRNKLSTVRMRAAMARGFGCSGDDLDALIRGEKSVDEIAAALPATGTG